jgi:hypothetical protein
MKSGGWVPLDKTLVKDLPKDRPYTKVEAVFSIQVDYDNNKPATISGYADLWTWTRGRVRNLLKELGAQIIYPEDTRKKQNQSGQIAIQITDRSRRKSGQIRLINSRGLQAEANRSRQKSGQISDRSPSTTRYPDPNPNKFSSENVPYDQVLASWKMMLPELPQPRAITDTRKKHFDARWHEAHKTKKGLSSNTLDFWEALFDHIRRSDFLMGRNHNSTWTADFDFVIKKSKLQKILEGSYDK